MERVGVGTVRALWRYPVKSMLGEALDEAMVDRRGVRGDRAFALRDLATERIASAKKFPRLLTLRAVYDGAPAPEGAAPVRITLPGGRTISAGDSGASRAISEVLEHGFQLEGTPRPAGERAGIDPRTVFGDVPFEQLFPGLTADCAPDFFRLPLGTFFDSAALHLVASGTLRRMGGLMGANSGVDCRRFRPNILVDTGDGAEGFVEDGWLGGALEIGAGLRITGMHPALRCVMTTHPQQGLAHNLAVLRAAAQHHQANVGVFAAVEGEGRVRIGDPVFLVKQARARGVC